MSVRWNARQKQNKTKTCNYNDKAHTCFVIHKHHALTYIHTLSHLHLWSHQLLKQYTMLQRIHVLPLLILQVLFRKYPAAASSRLLYESLSIVIHLQRKETRLKNLKNNFHYLVGINCLINITFYHYLHYMKNNISFRKLSHVHLD